MSSNQTRLLRTVSPKHSVGKVLATGAGGRRWPPVPGSCLPRAQRSRHRDGIPLLVMEFFLLTFSGLRVKTEYNSYCLLPVSNKGLLPFSSGLESLHESSPQPAGAGGLQATGDGLQGSHCVQPREFQAALLVKRVEIHLPWIRARTQGENRTRAAGAPEPLRTNTPRNETFLGGEQIP